MYLFICTTMHPEYGFRIAPNRPKITKMTMMSQFFDMASSSFFFFFDVVLFVLSGLVTGPSFMSISSLVLELWQFYFIGIDQKSENRNTSTWILSNIWRLGLVRVPNLVRMSIIKFYWMLQNASCSFCRFWVIKGKPIVCVSGSRGGRGNLPPPPPPRFRLKRVILYFKVCWIQ